MASRTDGNLAALHHPEDWSISVGDCRGAVARDLNHRQNEAVPLIFDSGTGLHCVCGQQNRMDDAGARAALGCASDACMRVSGAATCLLPPHDAGLRTVDGHAFVLQCALIRGSGTPCTSHPGTEGRHPGPRIRRFEDRCPCGRWFCPNPGRGDATRIGRLPS